MQCSQCGADVVAEATFCHRCGNRVAGPAPAAPAAAPAGAEPPVVEAAPLPPGMTRRRVADTPEEVLWEGGFSAKAMIGSWIGAAIASLALVIGAFFVPGGWWWTPLAVALAIWAMLGLRYLALRWGVFYRLTNQRLIHERGVLSRTTDRIEAIEITDVNFQQSFIDRLFGVGQIKITSNDASNPEFWLVGIENVREVFTLIDKVRRAERLRRSVTVENLDS